MKKLDHPVVVSGRVIAGDKLGRRLGFPTANLRLSKVPLIKPGVYLAVCRLKKNSFLGLAYFGPQHNFEVYLFNFSAEIYNQILKVKLTHFIRSPQKITSKAALKKLIQTDLTKLDNLVILVNHQDQPLGVLEKKSAHLGHGRLHRAISVQLFNSKKELLIQQRSKTKMLFPLIWANTVCTDVRPYESYEDAAHRRLNEELGLKANLKPLTKFFYQAASGTAGSEKEIDQLFIGQTDQTPRPNPAEIQAIKYLSLFRLKKAINANPDQFTLWLKVILKKIDPSDIFKS
ncbi:MAG: isopentenyl-diphosphate Delta-isomerase [Candidatus Beckwithbacteria bacterium]